MKILIVNAYKPTKQQQFNQFHSTALEALKSSLSPDIPIELHTKTHKTLDSVLYEMGSGLGFQNRDAAVEFDSFDIVILEGSSSLHPWHPYAYKFVVLLKMCLLQNKIVFASSFGMQTLIFLCACHFNPNYNIVNGTNGSKIDQIYKITKQQQKEMNLTDIFLDSSTGDFYQFNNVYEKWNAIGNVGLHSYQDMNPVILQNQQQTDELASQFIESKMKRSHEVIALKQESMCYIKKKFWKHWLFENLEEKKFLVRCENSWDCHEVPNLRVNREFEVLASSVKRGPLIMMVGEQLIATQFNITKQYKNTVQILKNFLSHKLSEIIEKQAAKYCPIRFLTSNQNLICNNNSGSNNPHSQNLARCEITSHIFAKTMLEQSNIFKQQQQSHRMIQENIQKLIESKGDYFFPKYQNPYLHASDALNQHTIDPKKVKPSKVKYLVQKSIQTREDAKFAFPSLEQPTPKESQNMSTASNFINFDIRPKTSQFSELKQEHIYIQNLEDIKNDKQLLIKDQAKTSILKREGYQIPTPNSEVMKFLHPTLPEEYYQSCENKFDS